MEFSVNKQVRLKDLQQLFHARFPFLKLEFLGRMRVDGHPGIIDAYHTVGELSSDIEPTSLSITADMTTGQLEELFRKKTKLNAEVFRKSGRVWLRTTATDYLTLEEQNRMGEIAENPERETREEMDYHEQE
ncbi:MAG: hypothetical protein RL213_854 [Bacteroidota bacterium]|jgi:hypothetical protein